MTLQVTSRADWGARPAGRNVRPIGDVRGIAWHYTAGDADWRRDHSQCDDRVRAIQRGHMDGRGYNDGAYNWLFCHHGAVYVMRGFGVRSAANGTDDGNAHYYAVCYLGGPSSPLTDAARRAALALRAEIRRRHPDARADRAHMTFKPTSCPGKPVSRWLDAGLPPPPAAQASRPTVVAYVVRRLDGTYYGQRPSEAQAIEVARALLRSAGGFQITRTRRTA